MKKLFVFGLLAFLVMLFTPTHIKASPDFDVGVEKISNIAHIEIISPDLDLIPDQFASCPVATPLKFPLFGKVIYINQLNSAHLCMTVLQLYNSDMNWQRWHNNATYLAHPEGLFRLDIGELNTHTIPRYKQCNPYEEH